MRHTPRQFGAQTGRSRGINTLIGNGWLRESPRNFLPQGWEHRGRSAMRKCMFLPVPTQFREHAQRALQISPAALPPPKPAVKKEKEVERHSHNPAKDVRQMPVFDAREAAKRYARQNAGQGWLAPAKKASPTAWWEDPIAIGSLLILAPPIGLAAVWSSRRYSSDARWALTIVTALMMCLASALLVAIVAMR